MTPRAGFASAYAICYRFGPSLPLLLPLPLPAVERFRRLHSVADATVRLFAAGDWTVERGRAIDAALRGLLLAWSSGDHPEDDAAVEAVLHALETADLFDPAVVADRGPFVERLLTLRDRAMLEAAGAPPGWRPGPWEAPVEAANALPGRASGVSERFSALLSRAFTRLYQANLALDDHAIVSVTDRHGTIVEVNQAFCRISGFARDELLGEKHSIVKSGRHPPEFYRELWRTIAAGRIWNGEICNRRKDGSYYWVRSTIIPVLGTSGKPEEYVSVRSEVSADRWFDERLTLLERAVAAGSGGVVVADALRPELPITYTSPAIERIFARGANELRGLSLRELLGGGQPAGTFDALDALTRSTDGGSMLLHGTRADDSRFAFHVRLSPVLDSGVRTHVVALVDDATELQALRARLRECDERLHRIQEYAGSGTWDSDLRTRRLHWSASTAALFGLQAAETETSVDTFLAAIHPSDRRQVVDAVDECLQFARPYDLEHRCIQPDGTVRWLRERGRVIRDERGRPTRMVGVVQDVTERKRLAAELERERQRLARTQALARVGDWRIDDAGGETWWSTALYDIYRRDPASFHPRSDSFAQAADARDAALLAGALESARGGHDADCLHRIALPDGERRWVRLSAQPEIDESGRVVAVAGTVQDVTDAVRREECARLMRRILAMGEDAIAIADRYGDLVYANAAWRHIIGHDPDRRPSGELLAACESPAREALEREIQRAGPAFHHRGDLPMRRLDGTCFVARGEITVAHDSRGDVHYFAHRFRDAGETLAHERAVAAARTRLEHAREDACRLVERVSEALRGPTQTVLASARMLAARPELSAVAHQYLHHIVDAGERALHVAGDVLDLARAEAGRLSLRIEPVPLERVFRDLLAPGVGGELPFRATIESGEHLAACCDPMRLVQALRALLAATSRAWLSAWGDRAARDGDPIADRGAIAIRVVRQTDANVADSVDAADDGRHLAGLLLAAMGGTLEAQMPPDVFGERDASARIETFIVRLPCAPPDACDAAPDELDAAAPVDGAVAGPATRRRSCLLYVDDDLAGLSLMQEVFRADSRVGLLPSPSARLALELAHAHAQRPDVVLLDIDSAALDAFALLRELKIDARMRDVPVIAITADTSERNRQRIEGCGFFRFVEKPLSVPELLRTIDAALAAGRRLTRTAR